MNGPAVRVLAGYDGSLPSGAAIENCAQLLPAAHAHIVHLWTPPFASDQLRRRLWTGTRQVDAYVTAVEREGQRESDRIAAMGVVLAQAAGWTAEPPQESADGVTVLVGVDGSPESDAALRAVLDLLPGRLGRLIAAEVVDYDAADSDDWRGRQAAARAHFADVHTACGQRNVECEVLAGPPAQALLRCAHEQDVDLIAVGRRGRGLSVRLLGSVADELTRTAPVPVLVVGAHAATEQPQAETTATVPG